MICIIRHCQELNSQPVPSQVSADSTRLILLVNREHNCEHSRSTQQSLINDCFIRQTFSFSCFWKLWALTWSRRQRTDNMERFHPCGVLSCIQFHRWNNSHPNRPRIWASTLPQRGQAPWWNSKGIPWPASAGFRIVWTGPRFLQCGGDGRTYPGSRTWIPDRIWNPGRCRWHSATSSRLRPLPRSWLEGTWAYLGEIPAGSYMFLFPNISVRISKIKYRCTIKGMNSDVFWNCGWIPCGRYVHCLMCLFENDLKFLSPIRQTRSVV